jgi:antitoxin VapB
MDAEEAVMQRVGDRLIIEPVRQSGLVELLDELQPIETPFPDVDEGLLSLDDPEP